MEKLNLIIVFGGKSVEHEASIVSTRSIMNFIDQKKYNVIPIGITTGGYWVDSKKAKKFIDSDQRKLEIDFPENAINHIPKILQQPSLTTIVFPLLECTSGEDGVIQGFLELVNLAYIGTGVVGSASCIDKVRIKEILRQNDLPVVPYYWFLNKAGVRLNRILQMINSQFKNDYPLFIKPANLGCSIGITKVSNQEELEEAITLARKYDRKIVVEKSIENLREIEILVVGNNSPECFLVGEVVSYNQFQDYNAKVKEQRRLISPPKLNKNLEKSMRRIAMRAYMALDCAGYARVDFFLNKETNQFWINEITTKASFNKTEGYLKFAKRLNEYSSLIDHLIQLGIERWTEKQNISTEI